MVRKRTRGKSPRRASKGFYGNWGSEADKEQGAGSKEQAGGQALREPQDERAIGRLLRDALFRHPGDLGKAIRVVEVQLRAKGAAGKQSRAKDLAERMSETLALLGEQFLPEERGEPSPPS